MTRKQIRQSNIELLRVLAVLLIIGHHFAVHGGFCFETSRITGNLLFLQGLVMGGKMGVDLFVLISGYFLVTASGLQIRKVVKFWLQIFFYSVVIWLVWAAAGLAAFTAEEFIKACFPLLSRQWWFAGSYFAMYLLSPLLNRFLGRLTVKRHLLLLGILAALWYVVPVFAWLPERVRDAAWFVFLYCIAAFLRLHGVAQKQRAGIWLAIGIGVLLLSYGYAVVRLYFTARSQSRYEMVYFHNRDMLLLLTAIPLFLGFVQLKIKNSALINSIAAASFGIYLIHDSNFIRYPLWQGLLRCGAWRDSVWLIPYALVSIAGVWLVCLALEWLRQRLLDGPFTAFSQWLQNRIQRTTSQ